MELETIKLSEKNRIFITLVLAIISGISYKSTNSKIKKNRRGKHYTKRFLFGKSAMGQGLLKGDVSFKRS